MRKVIVWLGVALALVLLSTTAAAAAAGPKVFPKVIPLPNGFRPEGIASGYGTDFYVGSLASGAIYKGSLRTGQGDILVAGESGRVAVGLSFDERTGYLFVAGGPTGKGRVYDTRTGDEVADLALASAGFVNDVVVTRLAAFFTNSALAVLYKVPLAADGTLPDPVEVQTLTLSGDWEQVTGFNANGIDATPNGKILLVVNSTVGALYRVDPETGHASRIDLGGASVTMGDGILLDGKTIYVVRNRANEIAVITLVPSLASGRMVRTITDPAFRVPTTIAEFGRRLYAVNARFDVPSPGPDTEYEVVQVSKR